MRLRFWSLLMPLAVASGCGSDSPNEPGCPATSTVLAQCVPDPTGENALVRITIRGLTGQEAAMEVRYTIGDRAYTRAEESVIPRPSPISFCTTVGATGTCDINVPVGKSVSLYAYEGSDGGLVPVTPQNPFIFNGRMHEFVSYSGDCVQLTGFGFGDCVVTASQKKTYAVTADFTRQPGYRVYSRGYTSALGTVDARDVLGLPVRPNIFTEAGAGGISSSLYLSNEGVFSLGTEITLTAFAVNQAQFIRWEGCKTGTGGTNRTCTLPSTTSGGAPVEVRIFGEYWQCANGSIANGPNPPACTLIRP